jgi:hypothetical protein
MQVIMTVVQNSVDKRHMGAATSTVTFFRSMGGTFGAAVFGAILTSRLAVHLTEELGGSGAGGAGGAGVAANSDQMTNDVQAIQALPEPLHTHVLNAFAGSLHDVFLWATPAVVIALAIAFFIKEVPLKSRVESTSTTPPEEALIEAPVATH